MAECRGGYPPAAAAPPVQLTGQPLRGHRPPSGLCLPGPLVPRLDGRDRSGQRTGQDPLTSGRQQNPELTPGQGGGAFLAEFVRFRVGFVR